jgi:rare lipoprotein A
VAHGAKQLRNNQTSDEIGEYKVGKPYAIADVWYYPREEYDYDETGIASWYGPGFHGKFTANGELYDQNAMTAAHRTLPMPSLVQVTNLENGRAIRVRINDRGPFAHGRIIDLSKRAAELLGFLNDGTAKVRVQVLEMESRELAMLASDGRAGNGGPPRPVRARRHWRRAISRRPSAATPRPHGPLSKLPPWYRRGRW